MPRHPCLWPLLLLVACSDDAGLTDASLGIDAPPPGQLSLTWTIEHLGAPLTCASIDASSVTIEIVPDGAAFGVVDSLSCTSLMGTTRALAPELYDIRITLDGSGGTLDGPEVRSNITVVSGQTVALTPIAFDVDPHGDLVFRMGTPENGNCTPEAQGGAGITNVRIELLDGAGACMPTTFMIAAGASSPAGTYASNCATATHTCIATDQDIRANGVTSGQHSLVITGLVGTAPCWKRTTSFRARSAGILTTLSSIQLMLDTAVPGCPAP